MAKRIKNIHSQKGFSLLEVLMAFTIFSFFITAFILSQGNNLSRSTAFRSDLQLYNLCERKINEALLDPPTFTNATKNDIKTGQFEEEGIKHYQFKIEYIPIELPDLKYVLASEDEDKRPSPGDTLKKSILDKMKKNLEAILWQLRVTVTNTESKEAYELATWVTNEQAKVDTNFGM